ncbi:hypothetical protein BDV36DRAFT_271353 [Aspergillus pseudocaelatus]|uniref:Uncharacterized protein n=1 Tax=Aspergillus pseudocaelatus TaxID=1825620 RepID=A0ABQ6W5W7_9EURO|nr:hypothetical protein BDV36DRAFT_271353 [Aspergillus pseudocaelatus]
MDQALASWAQEQIQVCSTSVDHRPRPRSPVAPAVDQASGFERVCLETAEGRSGTFGGLSGVAGFL